MNSTQSRRDSPEPVPDDARGAGPLWGCARPEISVGAHGHLPVRRIGGRPVISERLLDQWIDSVGDCEPPSTWSLRGESNSYLRITRGSRFLSGSCRRRPDPSEKVSWNWLPHRPWSWHADIWDEYGIRPAGDRPRDGVLSVASRSLHFHRACRGCVCWMWWAGGSSVPLLVAELGSIPWTFPRR